MLELKQSQETGAKYANIQFSEAPTIKVGNIGWLLGKKINSTWPCSKLDYRKLGPYPILAKINLVAY